MSRVLVVVLGVLFFGCPKNVPTTVAGSDDDQMDQYGAQLEELRARPHAQQLSCKEWCSVSRQVCDLSGKTCGIAGRHTDRADMQKKCVTSQEDCARFNDSCASCN